MSRRYLLVIVLLGYIFLFGCQNIESTNIDMKENGSIMQEDIWRQDIGKDISSLNSEEYTYTETIEPESTQQPIDVYVDEQGNKIMYGKNDGRLKGFIKEKIPNPKSQIKDIEELKVIGEEELSAYIPLDEYRFTNHQYTEETGLHTYTYYRYIQEYKSADFAFIMIDDSGNIFGFSAPNIGMFDNIIVPEINKMELKNKIDEVVRSTSSNSYEIHDMILVKGISGLEMLVDVSIHDQLDERRTLTFAITN